MCVIIVKKQPTRLDSKIALKALCLNPDGFGIQLLDTGEIHKTMDKSYAYQLLMTERPFVAHARLTTKGKTNLENTHPVKIDEFNTLFHNGTVPVPLAWDKDKSDTRFIAETLSLTPWQSWKNILSLTTSRFAYVRKTKSGKFYVNRIGEWFKDKGIFYSKDNVLDKETIIAVYGTLRKGYHNNGLLRDAIYLGKGATANSYKMVCEGIPYVRPEANEGGNRITVELYAVDQEDLKKVDTLEGHPNWYKREPTTILLDNGLTATAELYFNPSAKDNPPYYSDYEHYKNMPKPSLATPLSQLWDAEEEDEYLEPDLLWDSREGRYFDMSTYRYVDFIETEPSKDPNQHELF